jgi:hypothetical protein
MYGKAGCQQNKAQAQNPDDSRFAAAMPDLARAVKYHNDFLAFQLRGCLGK